MSQKERPFLSVEQMYQIAKLFGEKAFSDQAVVPKLRASGMLLRMSYFDERWNEEPEVTIDCTKNPIELTLGPCDIVPIVEMRMHADVAHRFWRQKISLMAAVTKKDISLKGPLPKVIRLLPVIKPAYGHYEETLKELGFTELLNYP